VSLSFRIKNSRTKRRPTLSHLIWICHSNFETFSISKCRIHFIHIILYSNSWDSSVGIATRLGAVLGFDSRRGLGIFLFITAFITALEPTQPPIQMVTGALSLKVSGRVVKLTTLLDLVPRSKNAWSYTSTPSIRLHGVMFSLRKARRQLYLYLCITLTLSNGASVTEWLCYV
jgi:hypothetical protein